MTWEIEFGGGGPEDVLVTSRGLASVEGLDAQIEEILADPRFRPGMSVVFDETELDWSEMDAADLRRRGDLIPSYIERAGDVRVVVVSASPVSQGIFRQMEAYAGGFSFDWEVAATLDEARARLR